MLDDSAVLFNERAVGTALGRQPEQWGGGVVLIYVLRGEARPFVC